MTLRRRRALGESVLRSLSYPIAFPELRVETRPEFPPLCSTGWRATVFDWCRWVGALPRPPLAPPARSKHAERASDRWGFPAARLKRNRTTPERRHEEIDLQRDLSPTAERFCEWCDTDGPTVERQPGNLMKLTAPEAAVIKRTRLCGRISILAGDIPRDRIR